MQTAKERVENELKDLQEKLANLQIFRMTDKFKNLSEDARELLIKQEYIMACYIDILVERLKKWND